MTAQLGSVEVEIRANLAPLQAGFKRAEAEARALTTQFRAVEAAQPFSRVVTAVNSVGAAIANVATTVGSMFNPTALAVGAIGTAIGFVQGAVTAYVTDALSGNDKVKTSLEFHKDILGRIADMYGEAGEAAIRYGQDSEEALRFDADRDVIQTLAALNAGTREFLNQVGGSGARTGGAGAFQVNSELRVFDDALTDLYVSMKNGEADFDAFETAVRNNEDATLAQKDAVLTLAGALKTLQQAYGDAASAADGLTAASQMAIGRRFDNTPFEFEVDGAPRPKDGDPRRNLGNDAVTGIAIGRARRGGGGSKRDPFGDGMERSADRLRLLEQEKVAIGLAGEELARYRAEMQFLNSVHDDWNKLTESQRGALEAEADKIGDAAAEVENLKEQQKALKEQQQAAEDAFQAVGDAAENMIMGLIEGGDAAKQAIAQLVAELLKAAILGQGPLSFFFGGGGGSGIGGRNGPLPIGPNSVPSGRIGGVRSAGGNISMGGTTINMTGGGVDQMSRLETIIAKRDREMLRQLDDRQRNGWRNN